MAEAELLSPALQPVVSPLRQKRRRWEEEEDTRDDVMAKVEFSPCPVPVGSVISSDSQVIVVSDEDEDEDEEPMNVINSSEIAPTVKKKKKNSFIRFDTLTNEFPAIIIKSSSGKKRIGSTTLQHGTIQFRSRTFIKSI